MIEYAFTNTQFWNSTLRVPEGSEGMYRDAETWKKFANIVGTHYEPDFILGDVDGDGSVGIADATTLIDHLLNNSIAINEAASDVDGDGLIGIADVTAIIDIILGN